MKEHFKKYISIFLFFILLLNLVIVTPVVTYAGTLDDNGDWNSKNIILSNTSEAQLMVRAGDVDNFGLGWPNNFDPFSGNDTSPHSWPISSNDDPDWSDRIMTVSGYNYGSGADTDGYTGYTNRDTNTVKPIMLNYGNGLNGITVRSAALQLFVDDFQPMKYDDKGNVIHPYGIPNGNNRYTAAINGVHVPELDTLINGLNQGGPIGKLITFNIPDRFLYLVESGSLSIKIDDDRPGVTGDGFAFDFAKLLINIKSFSNTAIINGYVEDEAGNKLQGAIVSASGIEAITDSEGKYELKGVPAGQVVISAVKPGYKSQNKTIDKVVAGGGYTEDFNLQQIEKLKAPTFNYNPKAHTKENVEVTINYPGDPKIKEYRIGSDGIWQSYEGQLTVIANCVIEARGKDIYENYENISEVGTLNIDFIDKEAPQVNIKVSHAEGIVNDVYEADSKNVNKRVDKILNPSITLKGDAYANISVKGEDIDFFQYQFIKSDEKPLAMPESNWQSLELNKETTNDDVVVEKKGYLNQRAYDVSHMPWASDADQWSKPELVFKYHFDATTYKAATYSANPQQYGKFEDYIKYDGTKDKRWVTNSVFCENMWVDGTDGITNYKEASKFWGYIKVPKDGDYIFGAFSDDGCKGYITADGETKAFVDMFKVQPQTFGTTNAKFHLKANEYYPIYLEYFNWGQQAAFQIVYSDNGTSPSTRIPADWFYPSKNLSPGEYALTKFTGSKGIKFPEESGDYYIAYRTGKGKDISREGIYGPFTVNGDTKISVSKAVDKNNSVNEGEKFTLEYTIKPEDIVARSTFKDADGNFKEKIYLSNIKLQDEYPENIIIKTTKDNSNIVQNGQKIMIVLDDIEYKLSVKDGKKVYTAEPVNVEVPLSTKAAEEFMLSESGKSIIYFTDVNEANRQIEFQPIIVTVMDSNPPEAPIISFITGNGEKKISICYPKDAYSKLYKIGEETGWMSYSGEITINGDVVVYAKCYDESGNESKITKASMINE